MFCCTLLYVHFSIAIILMGKRELFLTVPRGCLQFVIAVFPDHTHLLFWKIACTSVRKRVSVSLIEMLARQVFGPCLVMLYDSLTSSYSKARRICMLEAPRPTMGDGVGAIVAQRNKHIFCRNWRIEHRESSYSFLTHTISPWGRVKRSTIFFSQSGHVAYQIKEKAV